MTTPAIIHLLGKVTQVIDPENFFMQIGTGKERFYAKSKIIYFIFILSTMHCFNMLEQNITAYQRHR